MKMMNKYLLSLLLIIPFCFAACTDDDNEERNKGSEELILSSTESDVILNVISPESNAITFNWGSGSNHGTNAAITYSFQLAVKGDDFQNPYSTEFGKGIRSSSYTMSALNEILLNQFQVVPDNEIELEARVVATIHSSSEETQVSNIIAVKLKSYKSITTTLYILGPAANGYGLDDAIAMNSVTGSAGEFTWSGLLKAGDLKFVTTKKSFLPAYVQGVDASHLYLRESDEDTHPDAYFAITTGGNYRITLNVITLAIKIDKLTGPDYSALWFVGDASGWNFVPMTVDASNPFVFHYNAELSVGKFKIATVANSFEDNVLFIRPAVADQGPGSDLGYIVTSKNSNSTDDSWNITTAGTYKITLNQKTKKISIVPFTPYASIYLVGDATPSGWNLPSTTSMTTVDAYKFT